MYSRNDPRLRRTLNQVTSNLESANVAAQENLYSFSHNYINPCLSSIRTGFVSCTTSCFPTRDERARRFRGRPRGRAEASFDFYDDWDDDENEGLLGWDNDELDRLLSGTGAYHPERQPRRQRAMSYGARGVARRKTGGDHSPDPTIIPKTSIFGFLGQLPWKIGGKDLRYKPSVAGLVEHPSTDRTGLTESESLIEEDDESTAGGRRHRRQRSATVNSGATTDSLSSRGDLFPSEDEDDAVPLDDEFAMVLERRTTGSRGHDERSSGGRKSKRPSESRRTTRTPSSRTQRSKSDSIGVSETTVASPGKLESPAEEAPSMADLVEEEERLTRAEEEDVERKRQAAQDLARQRGLSKSEVANVRSLSQSIHSHLR